MKGQEQFLHNLRTFYIHEVTLATALSLTWKTYSKTNAALNALVTNEKWYFQMRGDTVIMFSKNLLFRENFGLNY